MPSKNDKQLWQGLHVSLRNEVLVIKMNYDCPCILLFRNLEELGSTSSLVGAAQVGFLILHYSYSKKPF